MFFILPLLTSSQISPRYSWVTFDPVVSLYPLPVITLYFLSPQSLLCYSLLATLLKSVSFLSFPPRMEEASRLQ